MNHDDTSFGDPCVLTSEEIAQIVIDSVDEAYAEGRADQLEEDRRLLAWAYRKLMPYSFSKQEDALAMDEIKLILMGAA